MELNEHSADNADYELPEVEKEVVIERIQIEAPPTKRRARTQGRVYAMQLLYAIEIRQLEPDTVISQFWEDQRAFVSAQRFGQQIVETVQHHKIVLDNHLHTALEHWKMHRIAPVIRQILRLAMCELLILKEDDAAVIINEAVDLTRTYVDEKSTTFVNGVLDQCRLSMKAQTPSQS